MGEIESGIWIACFLGGFVLLRFVFFLFFFLPLSSFFLRIELHLGP